MVHMRMSSCHVVVVLIMGVHSVTLTPIKIRYTSLPSQRRDPEGGGSKGRHPFQKGVVFGKGGSGWERGFWTQTEKEGIVAINSSKSQVWIVWDTGMMVPREMKSSSVEVYYIPEVERP